jgi:hypothetical protein
MNLNKILSDRESYLSKKYDNVSSNSSNVNLESSSNRYQYDVIFRTMKFCGTSLDLSLADVVKKWLVNLYS